MTPTTNNIALSLNRLNTLVTRNNDMTGRRCINAGNAVNLQDYVTLTDLDNAIAAIEPVTTGLDGSDILMVSSYNLTSNGVPLVSEQVNTLFLYLQITHNGYTASFDTMFNGFAASCFTGLSTKGHSLLMCINGGSGLWLPVSLFTNK